MTDVLLRYLLMAHRREGASRRGSAAEGSWLQASLEQLVETAGARITCYSQYEQHSRYRIELPASVRESLPFHDAAEPDRPARLQNLSTTFRLRDTLKVNRCRDCAGTGEIPCKNGPCSSCMGQGWNPCDTCRGEGELAAWEEETYAWQIDERNVEILPPLIDPRLKQAFHDWLEINADPVESFEPATAARHLGFETPEAMDVVGRAEAARQQLATTAIKDAPGRCLFQRFQLSLAPIRYAVVGAAGRAHFYILVGRGKQAVELEPPPRADGIRPGRRLGYVLARYFGTRRSTERQVATVGMLPASGEPTTWLTCTAYLGSYTDRFRVLDRLYDLQLERLLGKERPRRQSASLAVELRDGRRIRLVEIPRAARLTAGELRLMLQAVDALLVLEEKDQPADDFVARLRALAAREPDGAPVGRIAIDRAPDAVLEDPGAVPFEAIRRAFVGDFGGGVDWHRLCDRFWNPVEALLESEPDPRPDAR